MMAVTVILALALGACTGAGSGDAAFEKEVYKPAHARGFAITGAEGRKSTVLTVYNPWQGADSVAARLLIVRGGEDAPADFDGQVIEGDARRLVVMSSTHIAMLDAIGRANAVAGVSGLDYVSNPTVQARRDSVGDVGYEGNVDYELLASLDPDIVLLYAVSGRSAMEGKLTELGIPYVYLGDYLEESPLGKAEWLVAVSEIMGMRDRGVEVFSELEPRYNAIRQAVADAGVAPRKVMLNTPYGDQWVMPSNQSYAVRLLRDAGGRPVYDHDTGNKSQPVDLEQAYRLAMQADMWINVGQANTLADVAAMCPKFVDTPVFKAGQVYNNNRRTTAAGGNDYYEGAIVHPDVVLADLVKIMHPGLLADTTATVYYRQLQ